MMRCSVYCMVLGFRLLVKVYEYGIVWMVKVFCVVFLCIVLRVLSLDCRLVCVVLG